jgi:hypothetical protein
MHVISIPIFTSYNFYTSIIKIENIYLGITTTTKANCCCGYLLKKNPEIAVELKRKEKNDRHFINLIIIFL